MRDRLVYLFVICTKAGLVDDWRTSSLFLLL